MADTTFRTTLPPLKAVDLGDGTYALCIVPLIVPGVSHTTFRTILPALKAIDNGDGTFSVSVEAQ